MCFVFHQNLPTKCQGHDKHSIRKMSQKRYKIVNLMVTTKKGGKLMVDE